MTHELALWSHTRRAVARAAAVALLVGCGAQDQPEPNTTPTTPPTLELIREIFVADEPAPFAAAIRSDSVMVFVDSKRLAFAVGPDGTPRSLIRVGSGPGEAKGIIGVAAGPGGAIAMLDGVQRRLIVVNGLDSITLEQRLEVGTPFAVWWPDDAPRVWVRGGTTGLDVTSTLFRVDLGSGTQVPRSVAATRALVDQDPERAAMCVMCPSAVSGDSLIVSVRGDTVYRLVEFTVDGASNRYWESRDHPAARVGRFEVDSASASIARYRATFSRMPGFNASEFDALMPAPVLGTAKRPFVQFGFGFDGRGFLWTQPIASEGDSTTLHWFPRSGSPPVTHRFAPMNRLLHVRGDRLLMALSDDTGVRFRVFAIRYE
jgi:hypothetical protein